MADISLYHEERKQERDSMEFERLQRVCWVNILGHNIQDEIRLNLISGIEDNLKQFLVENYEANSIVFDRVNKLITFQIDMEEIEL